MATIEEVEKQIAQLRADQIALAKTKRLEAKDMRENTALSLKNELVQRRLQRLEENREAILRNNLRREAVLSKFSPATRAALNTAYTSAVSPVMEVVRPLAAAAPVVGSFLANPFAATGAGIASMALSAYKKLKEGNTPIDTSEYAIEEEHPGLKGKKPTFLSFW